MPGASESDIKQEPMFFSANMDFAYTNGGPITKAFIDGYLLDKTGWIIDSRVHMLMPGWYPCIPGWHHDDIPRSATHGQPNYDNPEYEAMHRMCVIGASAMPQFLRDEITLDKVENDVVYKVWNDEINSKVRSTYTADSGDVLEFGPQDFHRGMPAEKDCWRFFIRASRNTQRHFHNEIRKQVQVYMSELEAGWQREISYIMVKSERGKKTKKMRKKKADSAEAFKEFAKAVDSFWKICEEATRKAQGENTNKKGE